MFKDAFEALGVKVVPMGLSEVYLALSRSQIDGQDNGFDLSLSFKWHEVAKFWSATDHCYELATWYISEKVWLQLSADDRDVFKRAAKEGGLIATKLGEQIDAGGVEDLKKAGVTYVKPDLKHFRKAFANAHKPYEGKQWPVGLVNKYPRAADLGSAITCADAEPGPMLKIEIFLRAIERVAAVGCDPRRHHHGDCHRAACRPPLVDLPWDTPDKSRGLQSYGSVSWGRRWRSQTAPPFASISSTMCFRRV